MRQTAQGWGTKVIEQLAKDFRSEFPDMKGLSRTNLLYMRAFAKACEDESIVQQLAGQLPWFHNCTILDQVKDRQTREWYIKKTIENGWSRSVLEYQIETQLHARLGMAQNNFARTLPDPQSELARDVVIELKNAAFKFEYTGQLNGYLAAVDDWGGGCRPSPFGLHAKPCTQSAPEHLFAETTALCARTQSD